MVSGTGESGCEVIFGKSTRNADLVPSDPEELELFNPSFREIINKRSLVKVIVLTFEMAKLITFLACRLYNTMDCQFNYQRF